MSQAIMDEKYKKIHGGKIMKKKHGYVSVLTVVVAILMVLTSL
jgi:hypothetical protein